VVKVVVESLGDLGLHLLNKIYYYTDALGYRKSFYSRMVRGFKVLCILKVTRHSF
jgi:hypothetical protein